MLWFWLLVAWVCGAVAILIVQAVRLLRIARDVRVAREADPYIVQRVRALSATLNLQTQVRVVAMPYATAPAMWCLGRPRLLWPEVLPAEFTDACIDGLIVHELAHIKRRDHVVGWIELAASVVWWWNPLFWFVRSALREQAELACDGWVVAALPNGRRAYAESLLALSSAATVDVPASPVAAVFGVRARSRRALERRLVMIMKGRASRRLSLAGLVGLGMMAAATLPVWATGSQQIPPPPPPPPAPAAVVVAPQPPLPPPAPLAPQPAMNGQQMAPPPAAPQAAPPPPSAPPAPPGTPVAPPPPPAPPAPGSSWVASANGSRWVASTNGPVAVPALPSTATTATSMTPPAPQSPTIVGVPGGVPGGVQGGVPSVVVVPQGQPSRKVTTTTVNGQQVTTAVAAPQGQTPRPATTVSTQRGATIAPTQPGVTTVAARAGRMSTLAALPTDAQSQVKSYESDREALQQEVDRKLEAKRADLTKSLLALQDQYTKAGKLDEAVAIRDYIRSLSNESETLRRVIRR